MGWRVPLQQPCEFRFGRHRRGGSLQRENHPRQINAAAYLVPRLADDWVVLAFLPVEADFAALECTRL